jgi:hypothetical protein
MANQALGAGAVELPAGRILILPGHDRRGLGGRLLELLVERGAEVLPAEVVVGLVRPPARLAGEAGGPGIPRTRLGWLHDVASLTGTAEEGDVALDLFAAASLTDELREVLRRIVGAGLRWDEVEVVATEPVAYGAALDALAQRLGIPVTFAVGLPLDRTRPGRALRGYLRWIREDFPEDVIRGLIERGDVAPPRAAAGIDGAGLARRLRRLRIGRGRDRYAAGLEQADRSIDRPRAPDDDRSPEEIARAKEVERAQVGALRAILLPILAATPDLPDRLGLRQREVTPAELARGARAFLERVPDGAPIDAHARASIVHRLVRLEATATRATSLEAAVAVLSSRLDTRVPARRPFDSAPERSRPEAARPDQQAPVRRPFDSAPERSRPEAARPDQQAPVRRLVDSAPERSRPEAARPDQQAPEPDAEGKAPWTAAGGHLHLSDIESGGRTGRRATFIVGLDAARFPGYGLHDPLLVDDDRHRLNTGQAVGALPTSADRIAERRYALAELLARLRGQVTLSYGAWEAAEARTLPPAAEMLQAFRLRERDPSADYDRMHAGLGEIASAVPRGGAHLDDADVWLAALEDGGVMRDGRQAVETAYADLGRGARAGELAKVRSLGPYQGAIAVRPIFDPRGNPDVVVSSTRLERLGVCPRRYLLRDVLRVRPPDDPDLEPDRWLSPRDRGSLLHTVFERALQCARDAGTTLDDADFLDGALLVLDDELAVWRDRLPPAGDAVYAVEADRLRDDVRAFVRIVRRDRPDWLALERTFGRDGEPAVPVRLAGGTIRMAGAIDRIDRTDEGGLVIIDYKTGGTYGYQRSTGIYHGGRRLQHVLYAAIATQLYGASVVRAEYHFPTVKGGADRATYTADELSKGLGVVDSLLDIAASGHFHATEDSNDCRFCDYAAVCRVRLEGSRVVSPAAKWVNEARDIEELNGLRALREDR